MKRILISIALASASSVALAGPVAAIATVAADTATQACNGNSTTGSVSVWGGPGAVVDATQTTTFTRTGFSIQCSANVFLSFQERSSTLAAVAATSAKGNQYFGGHSNGGAVSALGKCNANPCVANDVTTGLNAAFTAASASGSN